MGFCAFALTIYTCSMHDQPVQSRCFYLVNLPVMFFFFSAVLLLVSCSNKSPAEHYGFIARLGNDTVSVERVTRQGNTVISDEVDRFPRVQLRDTVVELNSDGISGTL